MFVAKKSRTILHVHSVAHPSPSLYRSHLRLRQTRSERMERGEEIPPSLSRGNPLNARKRTTPFSSSSSLSSAAAVMRIGHLRGSVGDSPRFREHPCGATRNALLLVALLKPTIPGRRFAISGGGGKGVLSRPDFSPFLSPSRVSFSEGWMRRKGWKKTIIVGSEGGVPRKMVVKLPRIPQNKEFVDQYCKTKNDDF